MGRIWKDRVTSSMRKVWGKRRWQAEGRPELWGHGGWGSLGAGDHTYQQASQQARSPGSRLGTSVPARSSELGIPLPGRRGS